MDSIGDISNTITSFKIPSDAKIVIEKGADDSEECLFDEKTEKNIRRQFKVAKVVTAKEIHDNYLWMVPSR